MAVLPTLPGIEAVIMINGKAAHEYEDEDEIHVEHEDADIAKYQEAHTISKYIQSETDQKFSIQLTVGPPYVKGTFMPHVRLNYHISVDGAKVADPWCSRLDFKHAQVGHKWSKEVLGVTQKSGSKVKPFIFAGIATNTDNLVTAEVKRLAATMKKVGVIEIRVNSATAGRAGNHGNYSEKDLALKDSTPIPENALKGDAKSHGTTLGKAKSVGRMTKNLDNQDNAPDYPEVIFRFLYRDEESLKQLRVIPRNSPSSSRSSTPEPDDPESSESEAEAGPSLSQKLKELLAEAKAEEEAAAARKASRRESSVASGTARVGKDKGKGKKTAKDKKDAAVKIKRERVEGHRRQGRATNKKRIVHKAVIDLTGDDDEEEDDEEEEGRAVRPVVVEDDTAGGAAVRLVVVEEGEAGGAAVEPEVAGGDLFV